MYMILPPVDFQARCAPKVQNLVPQPPSNTAACSTGTGPTVRRAPKPCSPSTCLAQLEKTRDMALKAQDEIHLIWTTSTRNGSLARSALPHLSIESSSDIAFCHLQCVVDDLDIRLASCMITHPKVEYHDTLGIHHVAAAVSREQKCLARFFHKWKTLALWLQHERYAEITWSKEVFDLLETVLRNLQQLQNRLNDMHHDIHGTLEPHKTSRIQSTKVVSRVTSADVEFPRDDTRSNLRRRDNGVFQGLYATPDLRIGSLLLDERKKRR